jgi:integrase
MPRKSKAKWGQGSIFKPKYRDRYGILREGNIWHIAYPVRGERLRESTGTDDRAEALQMLRDRLSAVRVDGPAAPAIERTTFEDLATMLERDYEMKNRDLRVLRVCRLPPLKKAFGGWKVRHIGERHIEDYKTARKAAGLSNGTVNRELTTLRRMLNLGLQQRVVGRVPHMDLLPENTARRGFVELVDVEEAKKQHDDQSVRTLIDVAYITGWRMKSELLARRWVDVDFNAGELRLYMNEAKDPTAGRVFPLLPQLRKALERQREYVRTIEAATGRPIPWIFVRPNGTQMLSTKGVRTAFKKAGMPETLPHDFRRSAVRNLERAGVPRPTAMQMVGHKTESIYRRYAIVDQKMLDYGAERLSAFLETEPTTRSEPNALQPTSNGSPEPDPAEVSA